MIFTICETFAFSTWPVSNCNLMKSPHAKFQMFWLKIDAINFFSLRYMCNLTFGHCDVKMTSYMKIFH